MSLAAPPVLHCSAVTLLSAAARFEGSGLHSCQIKSSCRKSGSRLKRSLDSLQEPLDANCLHLIAVGNIQRRRGRWFSLQAMGSLLV